jgi:MarR family transcriptional regulator, organic hydroperoxide resistance regulator
MKPDGLEDRTIGQLLAQIFRLGENRMRVKMGEIGLHRAQGFALHYLLHHDGITQTQLARAVHITPATATSMLQRMERDGWIERRNDPADQRLSRVFVTEKAKRFHDEAMASLREVEADLECTLTDAERRELRRLLVKLHTGLVAKLPPRRQQRFGWRDGSVTDETID